MGVIDKSDFRGFTPNAVKCAAHEWVVARDLLIMPHLSISNYVPPLPLFPSPPLPIQIAHIHRLFPQMKKDAIAKILLCCDNNLDSAVAKLSSGGVWGG